VIWHVQWISGARLEHLKVLLLFLIVREIRNFVKSRLLISHACLLIDSHLFIDCILFGGARNLLIVTISKFFLAYALSSSICWYFGSYVPPITPMQFLIIVSFNYLLCVSYFFFKSEDRLHYNNFSTCTLEKPVWNSVEHGQPRVKLPYPWCSRKEVDPTISIWSNLLIIY